MGPTMLFAQHAEPIADSRDRAAWLAARRTGIGASEVGAVLGIDPWLHPLEVYADKVVGLGDVSSEDVIWGLIFEQPVAEEYARRTQRTLLGGSTLFRSKAHPWLLATIDQSQAHDVIADQPGTVEVKTTEHGSDYAGGPPLPVLAQKQQQLIVTGARWGTIVCLPLPERKLAWWDVEAHADFQAEVVEVTEEFWRRVERREPPDADGSVSSRRALARLFPSDDGTRVELADAWRSLADEWAELHDQRRLADKRIREIENQLRSVLGSAAYGDLSDRRAFSLKEQTKAIYRCEACSHEKRSNAYRVAKLLAPRRRRAG